MPGRLGKATARKMHVRQISPEIPSPIKPIVNEDLENQMPIDPIESQSSDSLPEATARDELNPMAILLANGQPLLTKFEEKYLVDFILKSANKDLEVLLREKLSLILQMNYGSHSSLFTLNTHWIYDFLLKHFQTLSEHMNFRELFDKFLKKTFDRNNSTLVAKHWQLQTLVNEHSKKQSTNPTKRRMTVRHIDFN
ncbi:unnamed protein product [Adineta ricciae]|uniref:Uncharacterized protein n=1 Tax=Adineta ricciae TaxID=249248 RepID=A0A814D141_ADIRI|nr:unnamed protein product [Adineta ricciae]CAF0947834.1 unnamed protein product [Adineta ricciae]